MGELTLGLIEAKFADIIWNGAPLSSSELARRAEAQLGWKKTTSFTVLKRLCGKGLFENAGGTVRVLVSREDFYARQSEAYVEERFGGSLPLFIAAFSRGKKLKKDEVDALRRLIEASEEESE